jgi:hypothetical protein
MSIAAAHYDAFARDVARSGRLWTVRDARGHPAPKDSRGVRAQPFWSSLSRVKKIIAGVPAYAGFTPEEIDLETFRREICPDLERHHMEVGVNWSGKNAEGFDVPPSQVLASIDHQISQLPR